MSSRNLELNLRARADTSGITKLSGAVDRLEAAMSRLASTLDKVVASGRGFAIVGNQIANQEARTLESSRGLADAIDRGAEARQRAVVMTKNAVAAEERAVLAAEKQAQATLQTSIASEKLAQAQATTEASASKAAIAEEKLAQERLKTELAAKRVEKEEMNIAKAREQARVAAVRAEEAESRLAKSRSAMGQIGTVLKGALGAVGVALSAQAIGRQLIQIGQDSLVAASRAEEGATKFKAVFGDMSDNLMRDLEGMASANRRSVYDLVDYSSQLQAVFTSMGIADSTALGMSKTIAQLGVDFGAFFNIADSHAVDNLTSALIGNHRAVKQFGIPLNVAAINMELMRMNMSKLQGEALEAAKVQARFNIIMRASADIQGAAIREAGTYSNVMKAWQASVTDLKVAIGQGLEPAMSSLAEAGTKVINALLGKDAQAAFSNFYDYFEETDSVNSFVVGLRGIQGEILRTGNAWERFWASRGRGNVDIGSEQDIKPVLEAMARASGSADEFAAAIARTGMDFSKYFGTKQSGLGGVIKITAQEFFNMTQQADLLARASQRTAGEMQMMQRFGKDIGISVDVDTNIVETREELEKNLNEMIANSAAADFSLLVKVGADVDYDGIAAQNRKLREVFVESFSAQPVLDLIAAQNDLAAATGSAQEAADIRARLEADLTNKQKTELSKQLHNLDVYSDEAVAIAKRLQADLTDAERRELVIKLNSLEVQDGSVSDTYSGDVEAAQDAQRRIEEANAAIVQSFKQRAFEILSAEAIEQGDAGLITKITQVAVSMGLITQEEANTRAAYASTMQQIQLLSESNETYALTAAAMGEAVRLVAEGIVSDWAAAVEAAKQFQIDLGRNMFADWKGQRDANTPVEYKSVIATEYGTSITDFTDLKSVMEEYDTAEYQTTVTADYGSTKTDIDDIKTKLQGLVAQPWVVQIQTRQSGGVSGGGGGGGGGGSTPDSTPDSTPSTPTYVVEGVTVNNYSGGPGVADQTRRGVLAAFRSLA